MIPEISQPKNQKPEIKTAIPGPKSKALRAEEDRLIAPGLQGFALMAGIVVDHARGSSVTDIDGNTFLDVIGGIGVNGLGHSHPKWVQAIHDQVDRASVGSFTSEARLGLLKKLEEHAPTPGMYRAQLYSGGAEAVESALRLAKAVTGKHEIVSFSGGFHGKTMGVLSLMGSDFKNGMGPFVPGSHIVPYANCYRCPLKMKYPSCGMACVDVAKKQVKSQSEGKIAAVIVEPMQGTAGNVIPPPEFLPAVKKMAEDLGALFIVDEMITGFGRTGRYWGSEGVQADILTVGKQFGGGYPISGLISRHEIVNTKPWSNPSGSSSSYGGNPLASAAAFAALKIIDEEGLVQNSKTVGAELLKRLKLLEERFPFVGEVRGQGLFMAIELVRDKNTREPLDKTKCQVFFDRLLKNGLLTMAYAPSFRIQPSMTIDSETANNAADIIEQVFVEIDAEGLWN